MKKRSDHNLPVKKVELIRKLRREGKTIVGISKEAHVSTVVVTFVCKDINVNLLARPNKYTDEQADRMLWYYETKNTTIKKMAEELGDVSPDCIAATIRRARDRQREQQQNKKEQ